MTQALRPFNISTGDLNRRFYDVWKAGVFRGYGERSLRYDKPQDCRFSDGRLVSRLMGAEQVLWFNGDESSRKLHVFARMDGVNSARVEEAIRVRMGELTDTRRETYEAL
ncbi:MAG: hypothetical protein ABIH92_01410, partial [Nanoarchaeota archaeon]